MLIQLPSKNRKPNVVFMNKLWFLTQKLLQTILPNSRIQLRSASHSKCMFTLNFSCVNIGAHILARFACIFMGNLGKNKLLSLFL